MTPKTLLQIEHLRLPADVVGRESCNKINRFFIGPLTLAQKERRRNSRDRYYEIREIKDARCISFVEAARSYDYQRKRRFGMAFPSY